jgi:hypothetical protein
MTKGEEITMDTQNVLRESEKIRALGGDPVKILQDFLENSDTE